MLTRHHSGDKAIAKESPLKKPINLATVSDVHLGHHQNPASRITRNLRKAFADDAAMAILDIIFIAGDLFDRQLTFAHEDVPAIERWMTSFLRLAVKHDVVLRVVEGTPRHDWKQSLKLIQLNEDHQIGANIRYIPSLEIEYIPEIERHVLYIPDQFTDSTDKTLAMVKDAIAAKGLKKVDLAIMHGHFDVQVPDIPDIPKHSSEEYLALVEELIFIGHDHHHTVHGRIIAQGSFDRLAHGEEEPKGHVRATLHGDGNYEAKFVPNENALQFVSIDCQGLSAEESILKIRPIANSLPDESHVRLLVDVKHPLTKNMNVLHRAWPLLNWTKPKVIKPKDKENPTERVTAPKKYVSFAITPQNIQAMLLERVAKDCEDSRIMDHAKSILEELA
jgi:DNA repair exonuclease SbcCD nuclease subunit